MEGKTQQASAAAAGMSARSARRWRSGPLPSEKKKRSWRTRTDAFEGVWEEEIVPEQREAARELIDGLTPDEPGFICREVVLEVAWVLERSYDFTRERVADTLMDLTASDSLVVEDSDDVAAAAYRYRQGGVGFSDLMILKAVERANAAPLHTFDHRLARMRGAILVESTERTDR